MIHQKYSNGNILINLCYLCPLTLFLYTYQCPELTMRQSSFDTLREMNHELISIIFMLNFSQQPSMNVKTVHARQGIMFVIGPCEWDCQLVMDRPTQRKYHITHS